MSEIKIPFNRPWQSGMELEYMADVLTSAHLSGNGPFTRRCQELLAAGFGLADSLLTTSCTDALEMAALLLKPRPGDEVIVPSYTFVSTANAFLVHGMTPVFADIDPRTMNIDPTSIASVITERTRAVVVVHYAGVACDMEAILAIAAQHDLVVIEDNAHGLGGSYRHKPLGSFGDMATLSFHETKNFTCGEGGALLLNDSALLPRAEILWEKGTDRSRFFRGEIDKYGWVDVGSSFLPSELNAAHLCAQLEARDTIQRRRGSIWQRYFESLAPWASENGVQVPHVPSDCQQAYHMFYLLLPDLESRTRFIHHLKCAGILAVFHYLPLHLSEVGRSLGHTEGECPVTERVSDRLVRLPFYTGLSTVDQDKVIGAVLQSLN